MVELIDVQKKQNELINIIKKQKELYTFIHEHEPEGCCWFGIRECDDKIDRNTKREQKLPSLSGIQLESYMEFYNDILKVERKELRELENYVRTKYNK